MKPLSVRFVSGYEVSSIKHPQLQSPCYNWVKGKSEGYGIIKVGSKSLKAHRLSWVLNVGDIPEGLLVRHKCDNRACVNHSHLELGTVADNNRDTRLRDPEANGSCTTASKLHANDINTIVSRVVNGETQTRVAKDYNVVKQTISRVLTGQTWGRISGIKYKPKEELS